METIPSYNGSEMKELFIPKIELTQKEVEILLEETGEKDVDKAIQKAVLSYLKNIHP